MPLPDHPTIDSPDSNTSGSGGEIAELHELLSNDSHANPSAVLHRMIDERLEEWPPLYDRYVEPILSDDDWDPDTGLTVMSYNMSCASVRKSSPRPSYSLWKNRRWRMIEELMMHDPDILCAQESAHAAWMGRVMTMLGYDYRHRYHDETSSDDGVTIFFKQEKLRFLEERQVMLRNHDNVSANRVALYCTLEVREGPFAGEKVVAVSVQPEGGDDDLAEERRLAQLTSLCEALQRDVPDLPKVFGADLQSPPGEKAGQDCGFYPIAYESVVRSDLDLSSAYFAVGTEPPHTTFTERRRATTDYLFYSDAWFSVHGLLSIPTHDMIRDAHGKTLSIPNQQYASEHFAVMAQLTWNQALDGSLEPDCHSPAALADARARDATGRELEL